MSLGIHFRLDVSNVDNGIESSVYFTDIVVSILSSKYLEVFFCLQITSSEIF